MPHVEFVPLTSYNPLPFKRIAMRLLEHFWNGDADDIIDTCSKLYRLLCIACTLVMSHRPPQHKYSRTSALSSSARFQHTSRPVSLPADKSRVSRTRKPAWEGFLEG